MALSRAQSVLPRGSRPPRFRVTRVVPVLLMSCRLSRRNHSTSLFVTQSDDYEQDFPVSHADDLSAFFAILKSCVDIFKAVRIFKCGYGVQEIHAMESTVL